MHPETGGKRTGSAPKSGMRGYARRSARLQVLVTTRKSMLHTRKHTGANHFFV
jgi:hypothetical protein